MILTFCLLFSSVVHHGYVKRALRLKLRSSFCRMSPSTSMRLAPSCWSCRSRKLKCDRGLPCSNCYSRRIDCLYDKEVTASSKQSCFNDLAHESPTDGADTGLLARNEAMQARIARLEQVVFGASPRASLSHVIYSKAMAGSSPAVEAAEGRKLRLNAEDMDTRLTGSVSFRRPKSVHPYIDTHTSFHILQMNYGSACYPGIIIW